MLRNTVIWKGGDPLPGQVKFTFWHVMFFAWFCNMAMHIGMSDLTVFRFARQDRGTACDGRRHVSGALSLPGLPPRFFTRPAPSDPGNTDGAARPTRLPRLRHRRPDLRNRRRLDHGQPDDLPRGPRLSSDRAAIVAI